MSGRVRVLRDGEVRLDADDTLVVPLTVVESGRGRERSELRLTLDEGELLHAQLTRALASPAPVPSSPWLRMEQHEDPTGWP